MNQIFISEGELLKQKRRLYSAAGLYTMILLLVLLSPNLSSGAQGILPDSLLTRQELDWLEKNRETIRYAPNPSWPPADFMEDGIHKGIVADYIKLFEEKLGLSFQRVYPGIWSEILDGLKGGSVDLLGGIHRIEERDAFLSFSVPYQSVPLGILVRNNYRRVLTENEISRMTLASVKGYV